MASRSELAPPEQIDLRSGTNSWKRWIKRFEMYLVAAGLDKESEPRKVSLLLHCIGESSIDVSTAQGIDVSKDTLAEAIKKLKEFMEPTRNVVYERYKFFARIQEEDEPVDNFVADLRVLASTCEFGDQTDSLIRDKIVLHGNDERVRERLLRDSSLTMNSAIKMVRAAEQSTKQLRMVKGGGESKILQVAADVECTYCGFRHIPRKCPAFGKTCTKCGKKNHFRKMCRSKAVAEVTEKAEVAVVEDFFIGVVTRKDADTRWLAELYLESDQIRVKLDSGAEANILPVKIYQELRKKPEMVGCNTILTTVDGSKMRALGKVFIMASKEWKGQKREIVFIVANVPLDYAILGLPSLTELSYIKRLDNIELFHIDRNTILEKYEGLFDNQLGCMPHIHDFAVDPLVRPTVCPPRRIPFALMNPVRKEIERMEGLGVIEKQTKPTEWVSSLCTVRKPNGSIRVCLDPTFLNRAIRRRHYSLNSIDQVLAKLSQARFFTKLDAKSGFWQVKLTDRSADLCTFNSPWGRYKFFRLPFGVKDAPEVYQRIMQESFGDLAEVIVDDLLVWGETKEEHHRKLLEVLNRAQKLGIKFNRDKLQVGESEVTYVGHKLTHEGVRPDPSKVEAIQNMPEPTDKGGVRRFLGFVNYLRKFIPRLSEMDAPLRELLKEKVEFHWNEPQEESFSKLKDCLLSEPLLGYFDVTKRIIIQVDSSKDGVGGVLLQNGRPVCFTSCALTDSQKRYSQIMKECLAVVIACEKFHQYLYGAEAVEIQTDHKPLETIFKRGLSDAPPGLTRMILGLKKYDLIVKWKPGKEMYLPDTLSRAYLPQCSTTLEDEIQVEVHDVRNNLPVSESWYKTFVEETRQDDQLCRLVEVIRKGWPSRKRSTVRLVQEFWNYRDELSEIDGVILYGHRLVVPMSLRKVMLDKIHAGHMGIVKCKARASQSIFWPGINKEIENMVRECSTCEKYLPKQPREPMLPVQRPDETWQTIAADFFHYGGHVWMVIIDYYSRWIEVEKMTNTTADATIRVFREKFGQFGIPLSLHTDGGPPFNSYQFKSFLKQLGVTHVTSSPYYSRSNGLAEKGVYIAKNMLRKNQCLQTALMEYRASPVCGTGNTPSQLMLGRNIRTLLPVAVRKTESAESGWNEAIQSKQKKYYDRGVRFLPVLNIGDNVLVQDSSGKNRWTRGTVVDTEDCPRSYRVKIEPDGQVLRRNRKFLRPSSHAPEFQLREFEDGRNDKMDLDEKEETAPSEERMPLPSDETETDQVQPRRSTRIRKQPDRLTYVSW